MLVEGSFVGAIENTAGAARQLTEQLLTGIRKHRAKVVVMDITGVPSVDATVANHLVQTVEAARLLGLRAGRAAVVEDSEAGVTAARAGGPRRRQPCRCTGRAQQCGQHRGLHDLGALHRRVDRQAGLALEAGLGRDGVHVHHRLTER